MSIDMSQFYQVFFEEAAELLEDMETLLVDLDVDNPDLEHLNAIFRVAHSIKGGAATFGFSDMAEVTHVLESLLDRLRKQELALRADMVDAFLLARDVIKAQLAGHRGEGEADAAETAVVCELLEVLAHGHAAPVAAAAPATPQAAAPTPVCPGTRYRIEFEFAQSRAVFDNLMGNLRALGSLVLTTIPAEGENQLRLEPCILTLTTESPEDDLWEALAFVVDPASILITPEAASTAGKEATGAPATTVPPASAVEDEGFGFFEPLYAAVTAEPIQTTDTTPSQAAGSLASPAEAEEGKANPAEPARRASDNPATQVAPRGRRESDKASAAGDTTSIRVNIEKVDQLINLVGELVITQSMLAQTGAKLDPVAHEMLLKGLGQLERNTRDLQESVMSIRMMPISFVFSRFPRVVRDLASKLGKEVELKTVGEGTELDKGLIEKISDPLTHLVRNSIDHGVETPEKRLAAGKPAKGTITLRAFHQGGSIVIEVLDDGAGLDRSRILAKARSQGMEVSDSMPDQEVWQLIFEAGFSTAEVVTDVSGRGVGMDVVRRNILALGGSIEIDSALGTGTRMSIRLPLTLAIVDGLSVAVGEETFIVPLTYIVESLQPRKEDIKTVGSGDRVIHVRGEYLPIVNAHDYFGSRGRSTDINDGIIVILEAEGSKRALLVDELLGQHQVVIKSLESNYRRVRGVSGATIMGNGRVALILDVAAIVRNSGARLLEAA